MATQKPIHTIRRGKLEAAIWENQSRAGTFYRATFSRSYRTSEGQPTSTSNFGARELPGLALLAIQAEAWMVDHQPKTEDPDDRAGEAEHA
jgi:hypothetical protein